jgi:tetratricopeptide (TPR) repeat protein
MWTEPRDRAAAGRAREELANIEAVLALAPPAGDPAGLSASGWRWARVGDARRVVGAVRPAAEAYRAAHGQFERAVRADPCNAEWQRDLSVSWNKLGDVRRAQGDLAGALQAYTASKGIRERLAAADPANAGWQRDLIVSHWRLADLLEEMADRQAEAAAHWSQALEIARRLTDEGRLASADHYFVEELERRLAATGAR